MSEDQKLIAKIAAELMTAHIEKNGLSRDSCYASWALSHAKDIVNGSKK